MTPAPAMDWRWAHYGKKPGVREDYAILDDSSEGLDREEFAHLVRRMLPASPPGLKAGAEALPWVIAAGNPSTSAGPRLGVAIVEWPQRIETDAAKRPIAAARYFDLSYVESAQHGLGFDEVAALFGPVPLPVADGEHAALQPVLQGLDRISAIMQGRYEWFARAAAALLDSPIAVTGHMPPTGERLRILEAIVSLLPYGMRSEVVVATYAEAKTRHQAHLYFGRGGGGHREIPWRSARDVGLSDRAAEYFARLNDLRQIQERGELGVVELLRGATEPIPMGSCEAALQKLRELTYAYEVWEATYHRRATGEQIQRAVAMSAPATLGADRWYGLLLWHLEQLAWTDEKVYRRHPIGLITKVFADACLRATDKARLAELVGQAGQCGIAAWELMHSALRRAAEPGQQEPLLRLLAHLRPPVQAPAELRETINACKKVFLDLLTQLTAEGRYTEVTDWTTFLYGPGPAVLPGAEFVRPFGLAIGKVEQVAEEDIRDLEPPHSVAVAFNAVQHGRLLTVLRAIGKGLVRAAVFVAHVVGGVAVWVKDGLVWLVTRIFQSGEQLPVQEKAIVDALASLLQMPIPHGDVFDEVFAQQYAEQIDRVFQEVLLKLPETAETHQACRLTAQGLLARFAGAPPTPAVILLARALLALRVGTAARSGFITAAAALAETGTVPLVYVAPADREAVVAHSVILRQRRDSWAQALRSVEADAASSNVATECAQAFLDGCTAPELAAALRGRHSHEVALISRLIPMLVLTQRRELRPVARLAAQALGEELVRLIEGGGVLGLHVESFRREYDEICLCH